MMERHRKEGNKMGLDKNDKRIYETALSTEAKRSGEKWQNVAFCYKGDEISQCWFSCKHRAALHPAGRCIFCPHSYSWL